MADEDMHSVLLTHNELSFTTLVDTETYLLITEDEDTRKRYAEAIYDQSLKKKKDEQDFKWSNDAIKLLLNIRLDMENEFNKPTCKKKKLWSKISEEMKAIGGYAVPGDMCDSKFRNLLGTYRVNKRKQSQTGEGAIKWEFFDRMDRTFGQKASSSPSANTLGSTVDDDSDTSSVVESDVENSTFLDDIGAAGTSKEKISKNKHEISLQKYLFLKLERDKEKETTKQNKKEGRWQEKKELKLKEIDAINNLAAAISETYNRNNT